MSERVRHHPHRERRRQQRHHPRHRRLGQPRHGHPGLRRSTPAGQATVTYTHDVLGEQTASPTRTATPDHHLEHARRKNRRQRPRQRTTTYQYNPAGNLTRTQDARGRVTTMAYDALNRLRASTDHTTGQRRTWTYGTGGNADTGQLHRESDPSAARCPGRPPTMETTTCSAPSPSRHNAPAA